MSVPGHRDIIRALQGWHPEFYPRGRDLSEAISIDSVSPALIDLRLHLGYPAQRSQASISDQVGAWVRERFPGTDSVRVRIDWSVSARAVQRQLTVSKQVRNVIAVGSGKGGVGKSTVAVNLALAMSAEGARVGLLDADIYGPSQPMMLGLNQPPQVNDGGSMMPLRAHSLQVISVGFLVDSEKPVIWRGPMASAALRQLFNDCAWDDLDYLVIDLPPGTGDIQLTLAQRIPVTGAVIVSTPQKVAVADALKSIRMFEKVAVPVLGLVENMSAFHCPECGRRTDIFGRGGVQALGREAGVDVLGEIPLDESTHTHGDEGRPDVIADPDGPVASAFFGLAHRTMVAVSGRPHDHTRKFGRIQVQAVSNGS